MIDSILQLDPAIRYVAIYRDGELESRVRPDLAGASGEETDVYEELLVNPTLLTLATQRGNIDCGGLDYVLLRYGNFFQFIQSTDRGHISVCIEADANALAVVDLIRAFARQTPS